MDLGGTNCRVCLIDAHGDRLAAIERGHNRDVTADRMIAELAGFVRQVSQQAAAVGVGVGIAGRIDDHGVVIPGMTNLPTLAGIPLIERLEVAFGMPVRLENDSRAAMLGEACYGAARGKRDALTLTLGTGIGGGLMLEGRIRRGFHGSAGEIGLTKALKASVDGSAKWVALEDLASPGGLSRTVGLSMEKLVNDSNTGDAAARAELEHVFDVLGMAIANAHTLLDLEIVLLSGGMAKMGSELVVAITKKTRQYCPAEWGDNLQLELAQLGEWAGATGAACLWLAADRSGQ